MKSLFIPILLIALPYGALCQTAPTQPTKSALVDFDKVLTQSVAGQAATKEFEQNLKNRQQQLDAKAKQVNAEAQAFQKKQASMSPADAQKRAQEIQQQYQELQQL